ncbi:MAG: S-layer homology domain-containing protein [Pelotomaculum sp.]|nr:S-layer homology domain-containing protein [Pelotomaculum sp.]
MAIACGLGLIKGDENGLFRPGEEMTWAELASLVTRAAPRLQSVRK